MARHAQLITLVGKFIKRAPALGRHLIQIKDSMASARYEIRIARMRRRPSAVADTLNKGEFRMNITRKLCLASILALSIAGPVQAQNPKEGDYYAPGPTTVIHATAGQMKRNEQGDYYVGEKAIVNHKRLAALKKCTDGIKFDSDRYVACMSKEGEAP
jgi:hypothetical protein